ncbi:hypothetical protein SZ64_07945 [Erythrobacter sp. SG61-1L]|uniref:hypothetical protein n=1 Tax=Erythrobacter sp. SG61-1L TaxID=1603897 RepID=UPI0006C9017D|nr:hypothetical protein [Erythrobacter sp. SG61-1L]KPL68054.1 hypothetical protein SZ64_07945 [Erythrobacter sp. SG61-1L]
MTQILRPNSNVTKANFYNGYAAIDETPYSDSDQAYHTDESTGTSLATLEVGLTDPAGTPAPGTCTVRYRMAKINTYGGALVSTGSNPTAQMHVYQGATLIASDAVKTLTTGAFADYAFTPDLSAVTDWSDLRLRLVSNALNYRGAGISFAELEVPDDIPDSSDMMLAFG